MTEATTNGAAPLDVVLEPVDDFAARTRRSTVTALAAIQPALDSVKGNPDQVFTIVRDLKPARAAQLVSLLNERHPSTWTFGGRTMADGTSVVQARYSENPELARPLRKPREAEAKVKAKASK